jgi:purine nucleosidase
LRIWIDTDLGTDVDDALALAYALKHPQLELVGVSTVFGDVELRTRMVRELLRRADRSDVPVLTGLGKPLAPGRTGLMLGHEGLGLLEDPAPRLRTTETELDAAERVESLARALQEARPDFLVAIGPMTNVGALAASGAALPPLAIMGGKLEDVMLEGMVAGIEEWNWFCDPLAVQQTLGAAHSSLPRIVPAEVTWRTALADGDVEKLGGANPLARALSSLCEEWLVALRDRLGARNPRVALHDPLTVAVLVEPELCPFESLEIRVDQEGRTERVSGGASVEVAIGVENEALREHLMEVWLR